MASTQSRRTYSISDTLNSSLNAEVLVQELLDAGVSSASAASQEGTTFWVDFTDNLTDAQEVTIDGVVAAHAGTAFSIVPQRVSMTGTVTVPDGTDTECISLSSGPLPAGDYDIDWYLEHKQDASAGSKVIMWLAKNNGSLSNRAGDFTPNTDYDSFAGKFPYTLKDGESLQARLTVRRTSGTGNAVAQRGRIFLSRAG